MRLAILAGLALTISATAQAGPAIPAGWAKVETAGFSMALPKDWREFRTKKMDVVKNPHFGAWGFMSPHASKKVLVRVGPLRPGPIADVVAATLKHLERKVTDLKKLKEIPLPKDEKGRDGVILILQGMSEAVSHKTKEVQHYLHLIIRGVVRFPQYGSQIALTHLVRGDQHEGAEEFFMQHISTFEPRDPAEVKKLVEVTPNKEVPEVNFGKAAKPDPAKAAPKGAPKKK
jgi:hypothetical protein